MSETSTEAGTRIAAEYYPEDWVHGSVSYDKNAGIRVTFKRAFVAGAAWQEGQPATGATSDGHHTFDELYDYRMLYHAHAARAWRDAGYDVVKSLRHSDGELCFGGGWFIVSAELPGVGQVTNHYRLEHWDLFKIPIATQAPTYDGHTPADVADRLRLSLRRTW